MRRIVVIGGGPAGMMAAISAAAQGERVLLIEGTARLGNKLRLTGGGHGNVTHRGTAAEHLAHVPRNPSLVGHALAQFDATALCAFLGELGVPTEADGQGRVFPVSRNAHQLASALRMACLAQGVTFRLRSPVQALQVEQSQVQGVLVDGREISARAVILATGGASYPQTGSDGSGLALAQAVGHTIVPLRPGLAALRGNHAECDALRGLSLTDVAVSLAQDGRELGVRRGDLLFTGEGFSGPVAHNLSLLLPDDGGLTLCLHWLASQGLAAAQVARRADEAAHRAWHTLVLGAMPARLMHYLSERAGVSLGAPWATLDTAARRRVLTLAESLPFALRGTAPLAQAMVTLGGVSAAEVDERTMGSRLVQGLFLAGEVLDVTGESGGYNLQLAFSTGRLAGLSAAAHCRTGEVAA